MVARGGITDTVNFKLLLAWNVEFSFASAGGDDHGSCFEPLIIAKNAMIAKIDLSDLASEPNLGLQFLQVSDKSIAHLDAGQSWQSRIVEDIVKHRQHLSAEFLSLFKQHSTEAERMAPDESAHSTWSAAEDDDIEFGHSFSIRSRSACGIGATTSIVSPVAGCLKDSRAACRRWCLMPYCFRIGSACDE